MELWNELAVGWSTGQEENRSRNVDATGTPPSHACLALRESLRLDDTHTVQEWHRTCQLAESHFEQHKRSRGRSLASLEERNVGQSTQDRAVLPGLSAETLWLRQQLQLKQDSNQPGPGSSMESHQCSGQHIHTRSRSWSPARKRGNHGSRATDPHPPWRSPGKNHVPLGKSNSSVGEFWCLLAWLVMVVLR